MMKRLFSFLAPLLAVALAVAVLSGCNNNNPVDSSYPLVSVAKDGDQVSRVYQAENKSVPEVAHELSEEKKPKYISDKDEEQMFLVYSDEWYHLQRDPKNQKDTLIEVNNNEFVRQNYNPSFLEGYIAAKLIDELFDSYKYHGGKYRGYTTKEIYHPKTEYHPPTAKEIKTFPPLTKEGKGTIIKRSDKTVSDNNSKGSIFKKKHIFSGVSDEVGKIIKPQKGDSYKSDSEGKWTSSLFSRPKNHSPPKTRVGSFGRITKRR